jgi:c-di-GMP-binding flagellar brake protein YcgR
MQSRQRRHHRRVEVSWRVTCYRINDNGLPGEGFPADTLDVSAGGIAIVTDEPIFRPTRVAVRLELDGTELLARGVVVRVGSREGRFMAALRFEGLDVSAQMAIARTVFRIARDSGQGRRTVQPGDARWWHDRETGDGASAAG